MKDKIIKSIYAEYRAYKKEMIDYSPDVIWNNSMKITAYRYIKDYLVDECGAMADGLLTKMYKVCGKHILSALVDEFMEVEYCDIGRWEDLRELIRNYLDYKA